MNRLTLSAAAVCWVVVSGCSETPTTSLTPTDVVGRYELVSVGGQSLPVALPVSGPPRLLLIADTLWLRPDSTYEQHQHREVIGPAPLYLVGRFAVFGTQLILTVTDRLDGPATLGPGAAQTPPAKELRLFVGTGTSTFTYLRGCAGSTC